MATIAERLKQLMSEKNVKASDIIRKTDINKGALSCYLAGKYSPSSKNIYILAKYFDVNEAWLMGYDVEKKRYASTNLTQQNKVKKRIYDKIERLNSENLKIVENVIDGLLKK